MHAENDGITHGQYNVLDKASHHAHYRHTVIYVHYTSFFTVRALA